MTVHYSYLKFTASILMLVVIYYAILCSLVCHYFVNGAAQPFFFFVLLNLHGLQQIAVISFRYPATDPADLKFYVHGIVKLFNIPYAINVYI